MNKIILIGNLTKDIEIRNTNSGKIVGSVSMATNKRFKRENGEVDNIATFHNLVLWGKTAEVWAKWLGKGSKVAVVGELTIDNYEDKNGVKKQSAKIVVQEFEFLSSNNKQEKVQDENPFNKDVQDENEIKIEDIPF